MTAYALPLDAEVTLAVVGGKGANLSRMSRAGFPVPPAFFVTTDAYHAFVQANQLQNQIVYLANDQADTSETRSAAIGHLFANGRIPANLVEAISHAYTDLIQTVGDLPVAVRSLADPSLMQPSWAGNLVSHW